MLIGLLAQQATQATPWWGVPLLAGLFAVGGVLLGQLGSWLGDRRKFKREDQRAWQRDVRDACARYLGLIASFSKLAPKGELDPVGDDLQNAFGEIQLVAPPEVVRAAQKLQDAVAERALREVLQALEVAEGRSDEKTKRQVSESQVYRVKVAQRRFVNAARQYLGAEALAQLPDKTETAPPGDHEAAN